MTAPKYGADEARAKVTLLESYLKSSIDDVGKKRLRNQRKATAVKLTILCLSGGATLLLGLDLGLSVDPWLKRAAFVLTSVVTVLNAVEPFFNYRALWVEHERANAAFFHVKDRLHFYVTGRTESALEPAAIEHFYDEYERVWTRLNQAWLEQRLHGGDGNDAGAADA